MTDRIIEQNNISTITTIEDARIVIQDNNTIIRVDEDTSIVIIEDTPSIIQSPEQGPPGPPAGIGTDIENLPFVGSGAGPYKTTTGYNENIIYEEFGVLDELFVIWRFPDGLDTSKDIVFSGGFFQITDGADRTSKWEVHVTAIGNNGQLSYTNTITSSEYPMPDTAYTISLGQAVIDHVEYRLHEMQVVHIRLKRVSSTNDSGDIGVAGLAMSYTTDGRVGVQGDQGEQGPPGDEEVPYAKEIDFIDDDHVYIGEAEPGTLETDSVWRIKYTILTDTGSTRWANGTSAFDKTWTSRASYTYL
jgi:hypothetical protein